MKELFSEIKVQIALELPFVVYRKPGAKQLVRFFQKNDHLYFAESFSESGFVMAPFDLNNQAILFPESESEIKTYAVEQQLTSSKIKSNNTQEHLSLPSKIDFELLVSKSIEAIKKGALLKVVVSRREKIHQESFNAFLFFEMMYTMYPDTFVYWWHHPKVGTWFGATPERLIQVNQNTFKTVSLAGTRNYSTENQSEWAYKEKEEQKFVTDFLLNRLRPFVYEISFSSPYTLVAGSIVHLKTDIEGVLKKNVSLRQLIEVIHPTPAVCGLPKLLAKDFILENEVHNRKFYSGFLGELAKDYTNDTQSTDLYVNIRCLEKIDQDLMLYAGCGITEKSIPQNEWEETQNKTKTMKQVLEYIQNKQTC
jgi:isochorismate synthase